MKSDLALSIVIPAHNAQSTILECVTSIVSQGVRSVEVIVVDDGSSDATVNVLEGHFTDSKVRVLQQDAAGVSVARNRGIHHARGKWIMFVDADDALLPRSLGEFLTFADGSDADICVADFVMRDGHGDRIVRAVNTTQSILRGSDLRTLQRMSLSRIGFGGKKNIGLIGAPWAKLYRRDFLERLSRSGPFTENVPRGQDVLFNVEAFGKASSVAYLPRATYAYVVADSSSSHKANPAFVTNVRVLSDSIQRLLEREGWILLEHDRNRMILVLLDEAVRRLGSNASRARVRDIVSGAPFSHSVKWSRYRDATLPGMVRLFLLRRRLYTMYARLVILRK